MGTQYGRFIDPKAFYLHQQIGTGELDGRKYTMQMDTKCCPIIISDMTGKRFTLDWQDILELAIAAGIDEADEGQEV